MRRKGKGKGKGKGGCKGTRRAFLGEEPAQDPEWWSEEDCAWWSKGKRGKKGFSKGNEGFWKSRFRTYQPEKVQAMISTRAKAEARTKKERVRKVLIFSPAFQLLKHPVKKKMAIPGNQTIGIPDLLTTPPVQLLDGLVRELVLHGWRQLHGTLPTILHTLFAILAAHGQLDQERQSRGFRKNVSYYGITTEFCPCNKSFALPTLRQKLVG